jgi:hypothetical protein
MLRTRIIRNVAALAGLATAMLGSGQEVRADVSPVFGAGTAACGYWLQHTAKNDVHHMILEAWVEGYLTADNQQRADSHASFVGLTTDESGRSAWISQYCQGHPLDNMYSATWALVQELQKAGR